MIQNHHQTDQLTISYNLSTHHFSLIYLILFIFYFRSILFKCLPSVMLHLPSAPLQIPYSLSIIPWTSARWVGCFLFQVYRTSIKYAVSDLYSTVSYCYDQCLLFAAHQFWSQLENLGVDYLCLRYSLYQLLMKP